MARHLVQNSLPMLHSVGRSLHLAKRSLFASTSISDRPLSFCAYRYWSKSRQHWDCRNSLLLVNNAEGLSKWQLTKNPNAKHFSLSYFCSNQMTKMDNFVVSDLDFNKQSKTKKSTVKEFTITDKISEHDLSIKLTKVQNLLKKGKTVAIFVKHGSESKSKSSKQEGRKSQMQDKLHEHLQGVKTLRVDFSNETTTRFTIVPVPTVIGNENIPKAETDAAQGKTNT